MVIIYQVIELSFDSNTHHVPACHKYAAVLYKPLVTSAQFTKHYLDAEFVEVFNP